jgi:hypothetical protein
MVPLQQVAQVVQAVVVVVLEQILLTLVQVAEEPSFFTTNS